MNDGAATERGAPDPSRLVRALEILLGAVAVGLYANTLRHGYALDDLAVITRNRFTQQGFAGIGKLLTTFYWQGYWEANAGLYRPLSMVSFAIEWQISPDNPALGHFVNVLLYGMTAVLLFRFLRILLPAANLHVPFAATLLFVVLAVHSEVVANIKSRDELLCFLLFLVTALLVLRIRDSGRRRLLPIALGTYLLCLLSKEAGLLYLPVLALLLYFFRGDRLGEAAWRVRAFAVVAAGYLALHASVIGHAPRPKIAYTYADNALVAAPDFGHRVATAIGILGRYVRLLVFPTTLSYDYSFDQIPITGFSDPLVFVSLAVLAGLAGVALHGFRRRSVFSFCIVYSALAILLTSNLFLLIGSTMGERFLYAPSLGFALAAALLLDRFLIDRVESPRTLREFLRTGSALLWILASIGLLMGARTIRRNVDWRDDFSIYSSGVITAPRSGRTHYNLGTAWLNLRALGESDPARKQQALASAIDELEAALRIDPEAFEALQNLGVACYHARRYERSLEASRRSLRFEPNRGATWATIGSALFRLGREDESEEAFRKALSLGYDGEDAWSFLGTIRFNRKDYAAAIRNFETGLARNPNQPEVLDNLASVHGALGEYETVISILTKSHALDPSNARTCSMMAETMKARGDLAAAESWAAKARSLSATAPR